MFITSLSSSTSSINDVSTTQDTVNDQSVSSGSLHETKKKQQQDLRLANLKDKKSIIQKDIVLKALLGSLATGAVVGTTIACPLAGFCIISAARGGEYLLPLISDLKEINANIKKLEKDEDKLQGLKKEQNEDSKIKRQTVKNVNNEECELTYYRSDFNIKKNKLLEGLTNYK